MPMVEITGPELPQEGKDRIAKAITEIIAVEEKAAYRLDTTPITVVVFREVPVPDIYIGTRPLPQVLETLPRVDSGYG